MVILFDYFNMPDNVYDTVFSTPQQSMVARVLINYMKAHDNEITKSEMSAIANMLHDGSFVAEIDAGEYKGKVVKLSYNKRQFYDRIITPMKSMGIIDYDLYKKTYRVSKKFVTIMRDIGLTWQIEADRKVDKEKILKSMKQLPKPI